MNREVEKQLKTSWETSAKWYDIIVGKKGHYYHQNVIVPNLLKLFILNKQPDFKLLDLACGQGFLTHHLPKHANYVGVDVSPSLIQLAKKHSSLKKGLDSCQVRFLQGDVTKKLPLNERNFTHATLLLGLQNLEDPKGALFNAAFHLKKGGVLYLVLNHPCFRIPRLSHWGIDEEKKLQYRRVDSYMSGQKIPIETHPGKTHISRAHMGKKPEKGKKSETTWSFHHSLNDLSQMLFETGFTIVLMEEWVSDKKSMGKKAKMENRARSEFPLFLTLVCQTREGHPETKIKKKA